MIPRAGGVVIPQIAERIAADVGRDVSAELPPFQAGVSCGESFGFVVARGVSVFPLVELVGPGTGKVEIHLGVLARPAPAPSSSLCRKSRR